MPARRPNSFIYRYLPQTAGDLHNGKLQALQVLKDSQNTITFESQAAVFAPDEVALHTYGKSFDTKWITIHDTAVDGTAPFNANTLAKAAHATPFKRPENEQFRPGSGFKELYFDETGDTNATSFKWRWFYTQQHGDDPTYEVIPNPALQHRGDG